VNLPDALAWLDGHINRELVPGALDVNTGSLSLDSMVALCTLLGDPQQSFPVVHITGTNGKGSVSAMVSELVAVHGLTVGTYTSPHLHSINERIARNGEPIDDDDLAEVLSELATLEPLLDVTPSWFELVTAAALSWFATSAVDVVVMEVGMLGRFDATNVVDAQVAVVTNVGKDHTDGRGDWQATIAAEKAGIIGPNSFLVLGETDPRLRPIFEVEGPAGMWVAGSDFGAAAERRAVGGRVIDLFTPLGTYEDIFVAAHGTHQCDNAAIAVAATEALFDRALDSDLVAQALGGISLPGRFQVIGRGPLVVVDGAHNPPAAEALARTLADEFHTDGRRVLVLGMLAERDPAEFLAALGPAGIDAVVACTAPSPRAFSAEELARRVAATGLPVEVVADPIEAVRRAVDAAVDDDLVLVTGSLYLVGAVAESLVEHREP
jgi:dihydrofolate synthase / folylpolyglutamate synthase